MRHIFQDEDWGGGGSDWQPEEHGTLAAAPAEAPAALDAALLGACLQQAAAAEGRGRKRPASEVFQPDVFQAEVAAADPRDLARLLVEEQQEQCILGTAGYVSSQPCGSAVKLKRQSTLRLSREAQAGRCCKVSSYWQQCWYWCSTQMTTLGLSTVGQPHMSGETVHHSRKCIGNIHTVRHSRKRM